MNPSTIIALVQADLFEREKRGLNKYGTTVDRKDLTEEQWLQHAYEEALDLAVYLKKTILSKWIEEPKRKFKVGDKVRIVECRYHQDESLIGTTKTILSIDNDVNLNYEIGIWWFSESELELIEE